MISLLDFLSYFSRLAKPKSAAQLKKEAKKKEKMEKFLAKQKKMGGESTTVSNFFLSAFILIEQKNY